MSTATTLTGNNYVQYRVPGLKCPRKEYFGKGESGQKKAEVRAEEIKSGEVFTIPSLAGRQIFMDELGQLYVNYIKIFNGKKHWVKGFVGLLNNHFLPCLCHAPIDELVFNDFVKPDLLISLSMMVNRSPHARPRSKRLVKPLKSTTQCGSMTYGICSLQPCLPTVET